VCEIPAEWHEALAPVCHLLDSKPTIHVYLYTCGTRASTMIKCERSQLSKISVFEVSRVPQYSFHATELEYRMS